MLESVILGDRRKVSEKSFFFPTDFADVLFETDAERWNVRHKFFFTISIYCLNLCNLWRFPRQALFFGSAAFIYFYLIITLLLGPSLLFFEVCLSQYCNRGLPVLFHMCPALQGVGYSILFYSFITSIYFSALSVYNLIYLLLAFNHELPFQKIMKNQSKNETTSENDFFYSFVLGYNGEEHHWRNFGLIFLIWIILTFYLTSKYKDFHVIYICTYICMMVTLIYTCIICLTIEGSWSGLKRMIVPRISDFTIVSTYTASFEQAMLPIGLSITSLVAFRSYPKFGSPINIDCLLINVFTTICTLISGVIFFTSVGSFAHQKRQSIDELIKNSENVISHVILSHHFGKLAQGLGQTTIFIYFATHFLLNGFILVNFCQNIIITIREISDDYDFNALRVKLIVCLIYFLAGWLAVSNIGFELVSSINKIFVGNSVLMILTTEYVLMAYFYGVFVFCDDIEFIFGYFTSYYFAITWLVFPILLGSFLILNLYQSYLLIQTAYDYVAYGLIFLFTLLPIVVTSLVNIIKAIKSGAWKRAFVSTNVYLFDNDSLLSLY